VAALWVKKSSAYDGQWMYGVGLSSDYYFAKAQNEYFVGDNMAFTFLYGSWTAPAVSTWFHVAQTYDAGSGVHTLYVNGAIVDSLAHGSGLYNAGNDEEFRLGSDNGTSGEAYFLHGSMDDVRVYSRALDTTEIQSSYAGSAPADSLAHWDFEEGSGRLAADRSGNGHDLALNGPTFAFECP
jgi:hypothetical protein